MEEIFYKWRLILDWLDNVARQLDSKLFNNFLITWESNTKDIMVAESAHFMTTMYQQSTKCLHTIESQQIIHPINHLQDTGFHLQKTW
jgi:hypothetical protein